MAATSSKDQEQAGSVVIDRTKWMVIIALVVGGVVGNWYFQDVSILIRALALVATAVVAGLILFQTVRGQQLWVTIRDARAEISKVVWPTRQETLQTTLIVIVLILIFALILWGLDSLLSWFVKSVIG